MLEPPRQAEAAVKVNRGGPDNHKLVIGQDVMRAVAPRLANRSST